MRVVLGEFEWDDAKAQHNARKHGVTFIEAMECFADPHGVVWRIPSTAGASCSSRSPTRRASVRSSMRKRSAALDFESSAHAARLAMRKNSTKTHAEPSRASLREIPEVDFTRARVLGRGRHVARARRSFETIVIDKKLLKVLGGAKGIIGILEALAESIQASRKKRRAA